PYFFTLGPHSFYWFSLEPKRAPVTRPHWTTGETEPPLRIIDGTWQELLRLHSNTLTDELQDYIAGQRWFAGKGRRIRSVSIDEVVPIRDDGRSYFLNFLTVQYSEGTAETYLLPL